MLFRSFPARLTPGEFVIRKKAVAAIGADNLHRMNKYGKGGKATIQDLAGSSKGGATIRRYRDNNTDIIQNIDSVSSSITRKHLRLNNNDKKTLFESSLTKQRSGPRFKGNIKYLNKEVWPDVYESIIAKKLGANWQKTSDIEQMGPSYPMDLYNSSTNEFAEVKFTDMPVSTNHILSKKLRQKFI